MALIKNLSEIKEVLPKLYSTVSNTATLPNFTQAESKYIIPIIGTALYEALVTAYDADTLDADELVLVKKLRLVIGAYATYDEIGLYVLTLQDSGAKKITQGGTEPIRNWEIQELKSTLLKLAYEGTEVLLNYLFEKKADLPDWTSSAEYTKLNKLLIKSGTAFNENYTLFQPQRTYFIMRGIMNDVQKLFLEKAIGKDLFTYLRDVAAPSADETECTDLLKKALCFFTVMKACKSFAVSFSDGGFTILGDNPDPLSDAGKEQINLQLLQMKIEECQKDGDSFLEEACHELVKLYSDAGATSDFKTHFAAGPLIDYVQREDRTSGNEERKIFVL